MEKEKGGGKIVNVCENAAQTEFENLRWNEGRRIVEIGFLAEQLKSCLIPLKIYFTNVGLM